MRRKQFATVQIGLITAFMLMGTFAVMIPTTSAGLIFNFQSLVNVAWENEQNEPLIPRGELRTLTLVITHSIARIGLGDAVLISMEGSLIPIHVTVVETPSWCTATVSQGTLSVVVQSNKVTTVQTQLSIQVDNNAPAYALASIKVKATAETTGLIEGYENEFSLSFVPAYKSFISPSFPESYSKDIGPMDTAVFPIRIANMGNARTIVFLKVVNVPEDWVALVTDQVVLEEPAGSSATAYLVIKPSNSFGYHNEEASIQVSMQPVYADDFSKKGEITTQTFLVESRGFSTPGFEMILFLGAVGAIMIVLSFYRKRIG